MPSDIAQTEQIVTEVCLESRPKILWTVNELKTFYLAVTIFNLKVKYRSFGSKHMRHKFINSKSYRN